MPEQFDVFLACAPKDYNKLPYVVDSVVRNVEGYGNILICAPTEIPQEFLERIGTMHYTYQDFVGLPTDRSKWKYRTNWCFQQHLKLFQKLSSDWYLTLDCDTIVNRPMKFFEGDKPICWMGWDQHHRPYFVFQEKMIGIPKNHERSFIADMNLFFRPIIDDMLARNGYTRESFLAKSQQITTKLCHIGEPELYGSYCAKYFPGTYMEKDLKQCSNNSRTQRSEVEIAWTDEEILALIKEKGTMDVDTIALHSWLLEIGIEEAL